MKIKLKDIITLDFETFYSGAYSLSLTEYNTSSYVRDPQFKVHCCAVKIGTGPTKCYAAKDLPKVFAKIDWAKKAVLAHNTLFDGLILAEHYGIVPMFYLDTASMTRGLHGELTRASLAKIAEYYGLREKSKTYLTPTRGLRELPPKIMQGLMEGCTLDNDLCWEVAQKQLAVYPEDELEIIDLVVRMFCDSSLYVDIPMARKALGEELLEKRAVILRAKVPEDVLQSNPKFAEYLRSLGVEPPMKHSNKTGVETYAFAQTDPEFIALLDHDELQVRLAMEARFAAKSTQTETRAYRMLQAGEGGKPLPVGYTYSAAKTHRLGGTNKLNLQNLRRVDKDNPKPSDGLRLSIIAPKNHVIVVCDSSQIEARVNAWQAGDQELLDIFATGGDPYIDMANDIYDFEVTKANKLERFVGKTAVLGLGYQMGHRKFQTTLAQGVNGPAVYMSLQDCLRIVNIYRSKRRKIVQSWEMAKHVLVTMSRGGDGEMAHGLISYEKDKLWLPNGLPIHYSGLHFNGDQFKFKSQGVWTKIYGGLLIENIVQALARIIVFKQMLLIKDWMKTVPLKKGEVLKVNMTTHDEVAAVAPARLAKTVKAKMLECMRTVPAGFEGLPLNAECSYDVRYSK